MEAVIVVDFQCPSHLEAVKAEVRELWQDYELGNDWCYFRWDYEEMKDDYPLIAEYLHARGVKNCLIHWWW